MTILESAYAFFQSRSALQLRLADRMYQVVAPEQPVQAGGRWQPYMVYRRTAKNEYPNLLGSTGGVGRMVLRLVIWAQTQTEAEEISELLRETFDGFPGEGDDGAFGDHTVQCAKLLDQSDDYDPNAPNSAALTGAYGVINDYEVWHEQTVPDP